MVIKNRLSAGRITLLLFYFYFFAVTDFCDYNHENDNGKKKVENFSKDENCLIFAAREMEKKKKLISEGNKEKEVMKDEEEVYYGDSCTVGSTSKSSSEWRSSINCRDSGTEDPFSSSSRRSCPKWESYTVFQKYDEEMTFLDRISAQKLHETGKYFRLFFLYQLISTIYQIYTKLYAFYA